MVLAGCPRIIEDAFDIAERRFRLAFRRPEMRRENLAEQLRHALSLLLRKRLERLELPFLEDDLSPSHYTLHITYCAEAVKPAKKR